MNIEGLNLAFEQKLLEGAKEKCKTIVLPEAGMNEHVLNAGIIVAQNKIAKIVLLVSDEKLINKFDVKENDYLKIVNITNSELLPILENALYLKRKDKGLTEEGAKELLKNPMYFGTMMVELGLVDGQVGGAEFTSADALRPALMKVGEDKSVISVRGISQFENNGYVYTFKTTGTIENFDGIEQIYKANKLIYELHCSGGLIK